RLRKRGNTRQYRDQQKNCASRWFVVVIHNLAPFVPHDYTDLAPYHLAEQAVGSHFAPVGSFLNWRAVIHGLERYSGSSTRMVTIIQSTPFFSWNKSQYSVTLALAL